MLDRRFSSLRMGRFQDGAIPIIFAQLRSLPQHKLVHSVTLPVGNGRPHDRRALERLARSVAILGAPYAREHLSFNEFDAGSERLWTGFLLPPRQDDQGVANAAARIDEKRCAVGVPVAFETGVNYLQPQVGELSDGCFFRSVAEEADCGILLDLHNLLANERNGREPLRRVFAEIPREHVWEIHLAGGMPYRGYWLDSHSSHIEDDLFAAARAVVAECPNLRAIVCEIMGEHADERSREELRCDVRRLRDLWNERPQLRFTGLQLPEHHRRERPSPEAPQDTPVRRREETLGALAIGRAPLDADPTVAGDPAGALYADLVASVREGVLYETVPFLIRLLLLSMGPEGLMDVIAAYRASVPPQVYGVDEARQFVSFVLELGLTVPYLRDVVDFEAALRDAASAFGWSGAPAGTGASGASGASGSSRASA